MPTYVYHCENCGHDFERFQKFSDAPIEICPVCQTRHVRKVMQLAGIQFKGSGWYINDSRSSSSTSASAKSSAESKPAESTPAASESKPASKSTSSDD